MSDREVLPLVIRGATDVLVCWSITNVGGLWHSANERQIDNALRTLQASDSSDVVCVGGCWLNESDLLALQSRMALERKKRRIARQNRREWNAEAVEAQHRFRVDDARRDYIADNYSPKDYR